MNVELERMREKVVMICFKALSLQLPGGTKEEHEKPQPGFKPRTF